MTELHLPILPPSANDLWRIALHLELRDAVVRYANEQHIAAEVAIAEAVRAYFLPEAQ